MRSWISKLHISRGNWHRAIILFVGIFIFALLSQFAIGWYERREDSRKWLRESAEEVNSFVNFTDKWELSRLWRAELTYASSYCLIDKDGLIINIQGFLSPMEFQVGLNNMRPGIHTMKLPETGETWRLLVRTLKGGKVILGLWTPQDVINVDNRLEANAKVFGPSIDSAAKVRPDQVSVYLEYAVIDDQQKLLYAIGSIPLRLLQKTVYPVREGEIIAGNGKSYGVYSKDVLDKKANPVGTIYTLAELDPKPWRIVRTWITNCFSSAVIAIFATLVGIPFLGGTFDPRKLLATALQTGESQTVEFKESLRWDHWQASQAQGEDAKKKITEGKSVSESIAVKNVAAFLNTSSGGTLLIGIADDRRVVGLERDYESLVKAGEKRGEKDKDRDRFLLRISRLLSDNIPNYNKQSVDTAIVGSEEHDVCVVNVRASTAPVFIGEGKAQAFFIRSGPSTIELHGAKTLQYCERRWPRTALGRMRNFFHS